MNKQNPLKPKEEFFIRNGGLLLEKQISLYDGKAEGIRVFNAKELEKATNNYDRGRILGHEDSGVYKGALDDRLVSIKTESHDVSYNLFEECLNEITILPQISHRNVVRLFGCCLETRVPTLVYEFMSNGTLSNHMHGIGSTATRITWPNRLRIAIEIAEALNYLHSATPLNIIHRNLNPSTILLDEHYTAKLTGFGLSVTTPLSKELDTEVLRTWGYLDPEYLSRGLLTDKMDVYSFGVVMLELLTGKATLERINEDTSLVMHFISSMKEKRLVHVLDPDILKKGKMQQLQAFADIAMRCVILKGEERPTMKEVVLELRRIKGS